MGSDNARRSTDNSPTGDVAYLARSEHRIPALVALTERPRTRAELCELTGASSSTMRRTLDEFDDRVWIRKDGIEPRFDVLYQVIDDGVDVTLIDRPNCHAYFRSTYPERSSEMLHRDNFTVLKHDDLPPHGTGLLDGRAAISCYEPDSGTVRALIDTDVPAVREWAQSVYESHTADARPVEPRRVSSDDPGVDSVAFSSPFAYSPRRVEREAVGHTTPDRGRQFVRSECRNGRNRRTVTK